MNRDGIAGSRILFISPMFFGYEHEIREALEARGALVDWLPDRPFFSPILRAITTHFPKLMQWRTDQIYRDRLRTFDRENYDIVLVVNGQTLSEAVLRQLKRENQNAKFILYLWDSIANRSNTLSIIGYFDRILSFDRLDARQYGWIHRPLFYGSQLKNSSPSTTNCIDISFVGTIHSDRYKVINGIKSSLGPEVNSFWYFYLPAPWVYLVYRCTNKSMRGSRFKEFSFKPLSKTQLGEIFQQSRCVIDVEHPGQIGLTMRTIEALGAGKKLITTNSDIKNYDFYNPGNICLVERTAPFVGLDFIQSEYSSPSIDILNRYSLSGWLDDVMGVVPSGVPPSPAMDPLDNMNRDSIVRPEKP